MSNAEFKSPRITHISWGEMIVEGIGGGKDFKLWPGGGRPWNWNETGTAHTPGIQPADVVELIEHNCTAIVLSLGMQRRLGVPPETLELLIAKGIKVHVSETTDAVRIYNELAANDISVGGLFHSTC